VLSIVGTNFEFVSSMEEYRRAYQDPLTMARVNDTRRKATLLEPSLSCRATIIEFHHRD
jgi:hypothetical protein